MRNYILAILLTTVGTKAELSRLEALSLIESGDNDAAIGSAGEVSRFQILPHVWAHYSRSRAFRDCRVSSQVAATHLRELTTWFQQQTGRPASDFDIYVLWNAGPNYYHKIGFKTARVSPIIRERARRYARLRATVPAHPQPTLAVVQRQSAPAVPAVPATVAAAKSATTLKSPLWPVFERPLAPIVPVPAFALTPVVPALIPPAANPSVPYTLGVFLLPTVR